MIDYIEDLESALIDVLDCNSAAHDIQANTGLSDERCVEIEKIYNEVVKKYNKRHRIS